MSRNCSDREKTEAFDCIIRHNLYEKLASYLDENDCSVIDYGAYDMYLKELLTPSVKFYPVNSISHCEESIVCDYNMGQFPLEKADVGILSMLLEYVVNAEWFVQQLTNKVKKVIISYSSIGEFSSISYRRSHGWRSDLSSDQLIELFAKNGFVLINQSENKSEQTLLCFIKATFDRLCKNIYCTGCGACAAICPSKAIKMSTNYFEPYRPTLDKEMCKNCKRCVDVCPQLRHSKAGLTVAPTLYEVIAESDELVKKSSSGGAFSVLANAILEFGGAVVGVRFGKDLMPEFTLAESKKDIAPLRKSKYIQARTGNIYLKTKEVLQTGRLLLFSGCPCQIAGLKTYLGKDYDNLYTVDLLCLYAAPPSFWKKYLEEEFDPESIFDYEFRSKEQGWNVDCVKITYKDGTTEIRRLMDDPFQRVFHSMIMMPKQCAHCRYQAIPREGDITIGDFHGIDERDPFIDDSYKQGISAMMVNSDKGRKLFEEIGLELKLKKKVPISWLDNNAGGLKKRKGELFQTSHDWLIRLLHSGRPFKDAVDIVRGNLPEIALVGTINVLGYGAMATNYALWSKLREFGYSVSLLQEPRHVNVFASNNELFEQMGNEYSKCLIPRLYNLAEMNAVLGNRYKVFITGSDQVFSANYSFHTLASLGWLKSNAHRISYAASLGSDAQNRKRQYLFDQIISSIAHYDCLSVRESISVNTLASEYGIKATHTLEPVLLYDAEFWRKFALKKRVPEHIFSYILDFNPESNLLLGFIQGKLRCNIEHFNGTVLDDTFSKWLESLMNAKFVFTDSFHGMCFAIIFKKPFVAVINNERGGERFNDLAQKLHLESRLVRNYGEAIARPDLFGSFDWTESSMLLEQFRGESIAWLKNSLNWAMDNTTIDLGIKRSVDESLIYYGAGQGAQRLLLFVDAFGLSYPRVIWDKEVMSNGCELHGVRVVPPDFESLRGRDDIKVMITIEDMAINEEVARELRVHGFYNYETFHDVNRKFKEMQRARC